MPAKQSRILGALLGVHAGDSLGATLEFSTWTMTQKNYPNGLRDMVGGGPFGWPAGHATDDTDLTRAVLLAYRDRAEARSKTSTTKTEEGQEQDFDVVQSAAEHSLHWMRGPWPGRRPGSRPDDIGGATATGLRAFARTHNPATSGAGPDSAGNGSLMRCIPTALFAAPDQRVQESMRSSNSRPELMICSNLIRQILDP
ncbi:hypothetical protein ACEQ8H_005467 [Pleosporales sp. CAS-2024a]